MAGLKGCEIFLRGVLSIISYLTSILALALHGYKHDKGEEIFVYYGTAGGMCCVLFTVILCYRSAEASFFGKRPAIVSAANGKQLKLLGPFLGRLIGWLFTQCKVLEEYNVWANHANQ